MIGALLLAGLAIALQADSTRPVLVDGFENSDEWTAHPADGVSLTLASDSGRTGRALRLDFSFGGGGGYAIARRPLRLNFPENYALTLWIRGRSPPNTFEFKLVDSTGENVWWYTERDRSFDGEWERITIRKRQISFAWGPLGGGELRRAAALELVVTAGKGGGSGSVWFDELVLTPQPVTGPYLGSPVVQASAALPGFAAQAILDGDTSRAWRAPGGNGSATLTVDFGQRREFGGLTLVWEAGRTAQDYEVELSDDGADWTTLGRLRESNGGRDHLFLPDSEGRYLRFRLNRPEGGAGFGLAELIVRSLEVGESRNAFFETIANESPAGTYPRYYLGERAYWTVIGADGAMEEALINEDGAIDGGVGAFSVEPFLFLDSLVSWRQPAIRVWLEGGDLPIPTVQWRWKDVELKVTGFGAGTADQSSAVVRYRLHNRGAAPVRPTLYLAVRPFQVNPPWQFLGTPGGAARIDSIRWTGDELRINGDRRVIPLSQPAGVGVSSFGRGEIVEYLRRNTVPLPRVIQDPFGAASAALAYPVQLRPGDSAEIAIEIPLGAGQGSVLPSPDVAAARRAMTAVSTRWREQLQRAQVSLPGRGEAISQTIRSTIAWVLINRDRAAIQPGSRSYERSWIRDGSLTSAALLRFGHTDAVREFIDWYAGFLYPNGKVPCCVDRRGADPVPEHDSHGEFIYLVMEYWRHTRDRALLERMWPKVAGAVRYIDSLRQTTRTAENRQSDRQMFFGLLPPSISHEGYSAKPMHSYWDDFFALRGLKDATVMAQVLGRGDDARRVARIRDEFKRELYQSIDRAMRHHRIDFIPGAADLGDFDPTSTTIAISPVGELGSLPDAALERTFERYWQHATSRRDSTLDWEAYTPYELRSVGAMIRLGRKDRALSLLDMFMGDREPPQWNQWPEVVWRERRAAEFIGDSPHTWVGSDFLRSVADLFGYERESDSALVVGAGIAEEWLTGEGVRVNGLRTWWGALSYEARMVGSTVRVRLEGGITVPPGGLVIKSPGSIPARQVRLDGVIRSMPASGEVVLSKVPAEVVFIR